mgnify:CR=1 FL=1
MRRALPVALAAALLAGALGAPAARAGEISTSRADGAAALAAAPRTALLASSRGHSGTCTTSRGVSVVVDFRELGGSTLRRCALPDPGQTAFRGSGLDALRAAGLDVTGVDTYGLAVVCRLAGKPSASTTLTVAGRDYRESCRTTPPTGAHWSYWHTSSAKGAWQLSRYGAAGRQVVNGGWEGWSFSLGRTSDPAPRLAPAPAAWRPYSAPLPRISGTSAVGSSLRSTRTIRWYRDGTAISGATASTYRLTSADRGRQVSVKVTGSGSGRASTWATSAARSVS